MAKRRANRDRDINVRLTELERAWLDAVADARLLPVSQVVRALIRAEMNADKLETPDATKKRTK
jgi:hypothetical protein